jgi:hypothetical protein
MISVPPKYRHPMRQGPFPKSTDTLSMGACLEFSINKNACVYFWGTVRENGHRFDQRPPRSQGLPPWVECVAMSLKEKAVAAGVHRPEFLTEGAG